MPVIGRALYTLTEQLRGSHGLRVLREIEHAPRLDRRGAMALQFTMLSRLLAHAEQTVPYYREMFRTLGIRSTDVRSLDDFARLPILTKDIVRERKDDLLSAAIPRERLQPHHSGGSTGAPLSFFHDPASIDASEAGTFRAFRQVGWQPGEMVAFFWGWNKKMYAAPGWQLIARQWLRRSWQFDSFRAEPSQMRRWVRTWSRIRPAVVHGYASAIARFAEYLRESGQRVGPVRGVFTTAERLYPMQRTTIEEVFGCHVFDCYGSSEVRNIATECAAGRMHVNADFVVLETADPVDGDEGPRPFLVTSLRSYGMPFIRYRNDDCGTLLEDACTCGSGFPLMDLQIARLTDHFIMPGGRVMHGLYLIHSLYGSEGIANFQFHQTAPGEITLWIVPTAGKEDARRKSVAYVRERLAMASGGSDVVTLDVREVEAIPLSSAGKHQYTRSDVMAGVR